MSKSTEPGAELALEPGYTPPVYDPFPICVEWRTGGLSPFMPLRIEACICEDLDALHDHPEAQWTACGLVVSLPLGVRNRKPTCPECLALLAEARKCAAADAIDAGFPNIDDEAANPFGKKEVEPWDL